MSFMKTVGVHGITLLHGIAGPGLVLLKTVGVHERENENEGNMRAERWLVIAMACAGVLFAPRVASLGQDRAAVDAWAPCRFLLGEWVAVAGTGQPGEAVSGGSTFALDLGGKVMVRKSFANYAPRQGEKTGISHQDLLIIHQPLGETQFKAFYVDNEGHEINYRLTFPKPDTAVFETAASEKSPRFRLEYQLAKDGTLAIIFSIAPPGGAYQVYTKGAARRK